MASSSKPPSSQSSPVLSAGVASTDGSRASTPTLSLPKAAVDRTPDDSSKLKAFLSILKKFIGVSDIAAVRFSLPSQLLEPIPNLEYWQYMDRPETFVSIPDSDDALGRMLGVLRFWFTKDLKYVKGKVCKPYNSVLGEFFRCNWNIEEKLPPLLGKSANQTAAQDIDSPVKVSYLTEQTSHHPPVSAFWIDCPDKQISACGFDQLSANFTGTRIKVTPGSHNLGIYITLHQFDEVYNLTHPTANLGGLLRGALTISVADLCYITCPKSRIKVILHYLEEGWIGKAQNKMQGVIFNYNPDNDTIMKILDVPESAVLARLEGNWRESVYYTRGSQPFERGEKELIVDLNPLFPVPKILPPEDDQLENESGRFWKNVTEAIVGKQFNQATVYKQEIEERQRAKAAERKALSTEWQPRFFTGTVTPIGKPELTQDGKLVLEKLNRDDYVIEPNMETAV